MSQGTGGTGGSGAGSKTTANSGTPNTGGGGGGRNLAAGGSGVVIIRYPSVYTVSGLAEATGSPFTEGTDKVSVFTAGTGNIQFS